MHQTDILPGSEVVHPWKCAIARPVVVHEQHDHVAWCGITRSTTCRVRIILTPGRWRRSRAATSPRSPRDTPLDGYEQILLVGLRVHADRPWIPTTVPPPGLQGKQWFGNHVGRRR